MIPYEVVLDPLTKSKIVIKLYRNVKNVPELRKKIISGDLKCCVINPTLILSPFQVIVAANKALVAEKENRLVTRSLYSEILFCLSISKNVSKSLPLFGIDDNVPDILVAVICKENETEEQVFKEIDGEEHDIKVLRDITDLEAVKKVYSITPNELKYDSNFLHVVVNKIVIKDL